MLALPSKYSQKLWVKISTAIILVHSISIIILIFIIISLMYNCKDLLQMTLLPLSPPTVCSPPSGPSSRCHPFKMEVKSCHSSAQNENKFTSSLFIGEKKIFKCQHDPLCASFLWPDGMIALSSNYAPAATLGFLRPWKEQEHSYLWALLLHILLSDDHSQQLSIWHVTQISPNKLVLPSPSLSIPFN